MSNNSCCLVLTTIDDADKGRQIAAELVQQKLVACVNILPAVQSVYRWQGKVESSDELLLIMKTSRQRWPQLRAKIVELHSYELPEIIQLNIDDGLPDYLRWIEQNATD